MKTLIKKTLLVLMVAFIAVFTLGVSSKVKAATVVKSVDFTTKSASHTTYTDTWKYGEWTVSGGANNGAVWAYVKMGGKKENLTKYSDIYIASPVVTSATSKVEVNIIAGSVAKSGMSATVQLEVYSDSALSKKIDTTAAQTVAKTAALLEFEPTNGVSWPADSYYKVVFNCANTSTTNGIVWLDNVSIYDYNAGAALAPSIELEGNNYTEVDEVVTLTATTANLTSDLVWSSSDNNIATVDQSGNVTAKSMGVATITAAADGAEATFEFTVYPTDGSEITIAQALTICDWVGTAECTFTYSVTGVVETIITAYNSQYNNITVTITDGESSIQAYRMSGGSDLAEGDKITITGILTKYSGNTSQFTTGATYVAVQDDETTAAVKEALNKINAYMSLAYKYTRDKKEVAAVAESIVMKHSITDTSTNLTAEQNNASMFGLDETLFDVATAKNKASNEVGLNKDGTMRLYANAASKEGTSLIISTLNGQKIVSIEVEFGGTVGNITVNGDAAEAAANASYTYLVDSTSVTIQNVTATNIQVWIKSITINLASSTEFSYFDVFSDVDFRIKCGVDKALVDIKGVDSYGIKVTADKEMELPATGDDEDYLFAVISLGDALTNKERLDVVFTVQAFVVIDGVTYVSESTKSFSVRKMVETYYADAATTDLVASLYNLITE